jgi:hypothetical protein
MKYLQYILIAVFAGIILWFKIKSYQSIKEITSLTPESLASKKAGMIADDYKKWVRRAATLLESELMERKQKGLVAPEDMVSKLDLLKAELAKLQQ